MWEIINTNQHRWGTETYPTREAAEQELKSFWKGVKVDFKKFTIREVPLTAAVERSPRHYDSFGYCDNPGRGY